MGMFRAEPGHSKGCILCRKFVAQEISAVLMVPGFFFGSPIGRETRYNRARRGNATVIDLIFQTWPSRETKRRLFLLACAAMLLAGPAAFGQTGTINLPPGWKVPQGVGGCSVGKSCGGIGAVDDSESPRPVAARRESSLPDGHHRRARDRLAGGGPRRRLGGRSVAPRGRG